MKKYIALLLMFAGITLYFSFSTIRDNKQAVFQEMDKWSAANSKTTADHIENIYKKNFYRKNELIDLYGISQNLLNKNMIGNFEFLRADDGMMHMFNSSKDITKFCEDILYLRDVTKQKGLPLVYVQIPGRNMNGLNSTSINTEQGWDDSINEILSFTEHAGIDTIDFSKCLKEKNINSENVFFKTDIHMTTDTELYLVDVISRYLDSIVGAAPAAVDKSKFSKKSFDFLGNLGFSAGKYFSGVDQFEMYYPAYETDLTVTVNEEVKQGSFEDVVMNGFEKGYYMNERTYFITNYLRYPSPYYQIDNNLIDNDDSILVIMDSNGLRAMSYLALQRKHITIVDPRFEDNKDYISEVLNSQNFDAVVVLQNVALADAGLFPNHLKQPDASIMRFVWEKDFLSVEVKNMGNEAWDESACVRLGVWRNGFDSGIRATIPEGKRIEAGETYTFVFENFHSEQSDLLEVQMLQEGVTYFGEKRKID